MASFYIVRHGETDSNLRHTCVGHKDVALNENGEKQAEALAEKLGGIKFDKVYSSPLSRAVNTLMPLSKTQPRTPVLMSYALIERDYGDWDDMTFEEIEQANPEAYREWQENWIDYVIPNGESAAQTQARTDAFIDNIMKSNPQGNILIMTHLGTARHIMSKLLGLTTEQSWLFALDNAGYAVIDTDGEKSVLKGLNL